MEIVSNTIETIKSNVNSLGGSMHELIRELYPICRSITGDGVRKTLEIIGKEIPIVIHEIPTGTKVFDWEVPKEWNIRDAYIKNSKGEKIVDFRNSNLHILNYSVPIHRDVELEELKEHLYYLPEQPDCIPYRTSYYKEDWGFCISYNQFKNFYNDTYEVCVDSSLKDGSLTYAEAYIPGEQPDEVLLSTHVCHPSLCNDNLSGIAVSAFLVKELSKRRLRYSYRFLFIPATIGAITWLSVNELFVEKIKHGLVLTQLGDTGGFTYKKSRQGNAEIDKIAEFILKNETTHHNIINFVPYGYDERQFCSPGFNLPMGCLTRTPYGQYAEYHTSADNLNFVKAESLENSLQTCLSIVEMLEANRKFINLNPECEPQLGRRGLYDFMGGKNDSNLFQLALLWILNMSDGAHSLLEIAQQSELKFALIKEASEALYAGGLLKEIR